MLTPLETCSIALKEWAVVCCALETRGQSILLRKGGISEPGGIFRCEHDSFWLYPTRFHQGAESLTPSGVALLQQLRHPADPGVMPISVLAHVQSVQHITSPEQLSLFFDRQILTPEVILQRFHYKRPELFAIEVSCTVLDTPFFVKETPEMAGCHSWVQLSGVPRILA